MKIKALFLKYSGRIILCVVLLLFAVFFVPTEEAYYLSATVKHYQHSILRPLLLGLCIVLFLVVAVLRIINIKSLKDALIGAFSALVLLVCMSIIFERLVLSGILFVNRSITTDRNIGKQYVVKFYDSSPGTKKRMLISDPVSKEYLKDDILFESISPNGVPQEGLITVAFDKGIFGIEYPHLNNQ